MSDLCRETTVSTQRAGVLSSMLAGASLLYSGCGCCLRRQDFEHFFFVLRHSECIELISTLLKMWDPWLSCWSNAKRGKYREWAQREVHHLNWNIWGDFLPASDTSVENEVALGKHWILNQPPSRWDELLKLLDQHDSLGERRAQSKCSIQRIYYYKWESCLWLW